MSDASGASGPELAVLDDLVVAGFPIDAKPYCVIAGRLGMLEGDVLETVLGLRMGGTIERIGATFDREGYAALSGDELALADLLAGDLPTSENPFAELAAELLRRGVDAEESWVLERAAAWVDSEVITEFGVTIATDTDA